MGEKNISLNTLSFLHNYVGHIFFVTSFLFLIHKSTFLWNCNLYAVVVCTSWNALRIYVLVCIFVLHDVYQEILSIVVGYVILICLSFFLSHSFCREQREQRGTRRHSTTVALADGNSVNTANKEENKRDFFLT
jgi:hypothetical protein